MKAEVLLAIAALLILKQCADSPTVADREGGGSEVVAVIADSMGAAISGADSYIRRADFLADPAHTAPAPDGRSDGEGTASVRVDETGAYVVEARVGTTLAAVVPCTLVAGVSLTDLDTVRLYSTGAVGGEVTWLGSTSSETYYAGVYGVERVAQVSEGRYRVAGLARGDYSLRIFSIVTQTPARTIPVVTVESGRESSAPSALLADVCGDYTCDSAIAAHILDVNGLQGIAIDAVTTVSQGRVASLDVGSHGLSILPGAVEYLSALSRLDIQHNSLSALPPEIGMLANLDTLYANHNTIASVPEEIGNLAQLRVLRLSSNELQTVPPTFLGLVSLVELSISDNRICEPLPDSLAAWLDSVDPDWGLSQICP